MEFRILGAVELWSDGTRYDLGSRKERCVLAVLLYELGRPIAADTLIGHVWGDDRPAQALNSLYSNVSRLRARLLQADRIDRDWRLRRSGSYALDVSPGEVDFRRFRELRNKARAAATSGDDERAADLFQEAEGLWRGVPLAGIGGAWADRVRITLNEERLVATQERIRTGLRLGRHADLVGEVGDIAAQNPLNEQLVELLMVALYGSGRRAEALETFRLADRRWRDEFGSDPGFKLRDLHQRMLRDDPGLSATLPPSVAPNRGAVPPNATPADTRASTLPPDNPQFTGRRAELDRLSGWIRAADTSSAVTVVVISGMAGVGKSALALHAAHALGDRYPDQLHVRLRGHSPDGDPVNPVAALGSLLRSLGIGDAVIPADVEDRAALWRSRLAGRRALILLDDALDSAQVRPLLPGAPGCLVLITTRRRAIEVPGMCWLSLDPMPPADAASLFARIAGKDRADDDADVSSVLRLCGYLPLEIQLAGSELRRHPTWAVRDLSSRLRENHPEDRQVGAALALSYRYLTTTQQRLLRQLALHPGPNFSRYAAAAMAAGQSLAETQRALDVLLDHHLIEEPAPGRFAFHDLISEYARYLAMAYDTDADRHGTKRRLLDYYLCLADRADRVVYPFHRRLPARLGRVPVNLPPLNTRRDGQKWLEAERPSLLAVARYAAEDGWAKHAGLLPHVLARFLDTWGYWADAADLHRLAVTAWRAAGHASGQVKALTELCFILARMARYDEALQSGRDALALARAAKDRMAEADALDRLGIVLWWSARYGEALAHYDEALAIWRALDDRDGEADALGYSAIILWHLNRYTDALRRAEQALAIYHELGNMQGEANSLNNIGDLQQSAGCHDQALGSYQRALEMFRDIGDRRGEAIVLNNFGDFCRNTGQNEDALGYYRTALDIYRDIGDRRCEADALNNMGAAYQQLGHYIDAIDQHQKALVLAHQITERFLQARSYHGTGDAHRAAGQFGAAADDYLAAIDLSQQIHDRYQEGQARKGLGHALLRTEGAAAAQVQWRRALDIFEDIQKKSDADEVRAMLTLRDTGFGLRLSTHPIRHNKSMTREFTVVEICAGAGGQSLGLELAGFKHSLAVEFTDRRVCNSVLYWGFTSRTCTGRGTSNLVRLGRALAAVRPGERASGTR